MNDILDLVRARHAKAITKVDRATKALDSARSELADIEATLRVLGDLTTGGEAESPKGGQSDAVAERQQNIIRLLPDGPPGVEPKELHARYEFAFSEEISLDTFRTTIWRMKKEGRAFTCEDEEWKVENAEGRYWRDRIREPADDDFSHWGQPDHPDGEEISF